MGPLEDLSMTYVSTSEMALRVILAMVFGLMLGLDRDAKNKPIDFRAFMIVAVTTCIIAMVGQELYADFASSDAVVNVDLSKIISGALTGIGFLGAGAIVHKDGIQVVGTATGASIWASGGIGLALGFGFYVLAFAAFLAVAIILVGGGYWMSSWGGQEDKEKETDS